MIKPPYIKESNFYVIIGINRIIFHLFVIVFVNLYVTMRRILSKICTGSLIGIFGAVRFLILIYIGIITAYIKPKIS